MQPTHSVLNLPTSVDPGGLHFFHATAEIDLAVIRSGILVYLQDQRSVDDLDTPVRILSALRSKAQAEGLEETAARLKDCERALTGILDGESSAKEQRSRYALDLIAEIEASLLKVSLQDGDLDFSISGFLDESFERLTQGSVNETPEDKSEAEGGFEIDEETLEIFRSEAAELLEGISINLKTLTGKPNDRDALWNIRRCAHTFKGASGVIGLKEASELAHRVEDLLDQLAEDQSEATSSVIELLTVSTAQLNSMTLGCGPAEHSKSLAAIYSDFDRVMTDTPSSSGPEIFSRELVKTETCESNVAPVKPLPAPFVRVALNKLDELLDLTRELERNASAIWQQNLTNQIREKLLQLRMVRFGMLATRLNRAVHVTCQEEAKKAELVIDNGDFEIDTQTLDSLVEPLLHLLRNGVVHGIESPERRRLIGKPEKGLIRIRIESVCDEIVVSVLDDGRGISAAKLREKAVSSGIMDAVSVASLTDEEAIKFIFSRGLTTADKLSLNAGRGVGMNIVKESIGSIGGSISIASEPQKGTAFTINIPLVLDARHPHTTNGSQPTLQSAEQRNDLSILIIDDSSSVRQMIKRLIENAGWIGLTATNGRNAVEILGVRKNRPDIILTDLEMPDLNGYELLELLKNDSDLRDIPVVMITSRADQAHRQRALDLGAADFVTKPFDGNALIEIIERLCGISKKSIAITSPAACSDGSRPY